MIAAGPGPLSLSPMIMPANGPMRVGGFHPAMLETLWEPPAFLHWAGLGRFPKVGPELTEMGTIVEGSPIVLASGGALRTEKMSGTSYRLAAASPVNPAAGQDTVILWCGDLESVGAGTDCLAGTYAVTGGWMFYRSASSTIRVLTMDHLGTTITGSFTPTDPLTPVLLLAIIKFNDTGRLRTKPSDVAGLTAVAGNVLGPGIGVCSRPYAGSPIPLVANCQYAYQAVWHGTGLSALWTAVRIAQLYALAGVV